MATMKNGVVLVGMDAITSYVGRSDKIIKNWAKTQNFPATKIDGRWTAHTDLIDGFMKNRILERTLPGVS